MQAVLGQRIERYTVTALAGAFALGALIEDLVRPSLTIAGHRYDRAPEAVLSGVLVGVVALVALRRRLGIIAPCGALVLVGLAALPARAWVLNSAFVFLLGMLVSGVIGYLAVTRVESLSLAVIAVVAGLSEARNPDHSAAHGVLVFAFMAIAWCAGLLARRPVTQAQVAQERVTRIEHGQAVAAQRAVVEERQRIARELHDIIAHSVSVMTMQAGAVRRLLTPEQERERQSLLAVEKTGRDAMAEMRRLVGLLKEDESAAAYSPQPGMRSLDGLVASVREAGLSVELVQEGQRHELSPGVDLTAFRVVQEALTNSLKYAGPAHVLVKISWGTDELSMEIDDDGHTRTPDTGSGFGQVGMRERLSLYGGRLESGPGADGGYVVRAYLPVGGEPA